jgi:hypothetical protein
MLEGLLEHSHPRTNGKNIFTAARTVVIAPLHRVWSLTNQGFHVPAPRASSLSLLKALVEECQTQTKEMTKW